MITFRILMDNLGFNTDCTVLILAAGESKRMGMAKCLLLSASQKTFIEAIVEGYSQFGCSQIVVVIGEENASKLSTELPDFCCRISFVINDNPSWGRFYSLKAGLSKCIPNSPVFVHNIDNPFVCSDVLDCLLRSLSSNDFVYPEHKGRGGHPVLLGSLVCQSIINFNENDVSLKEYLNKFKGKGVEVEEAGVKLNINTLTDYKTYLNS